MKPGFAQIQVPFSSSSRSWSSYWISRYSDNLIATAVSHNEIDLIWNNHGTQDYTGHKIYISTDSINYTLNKTISTIGSSTSITGLSEYTTYYFKIAPYKNGNISLIFSNVDGDKTFVEKYSAGYSAMSIKPSKEIAQATSDFIKTNVDSGFWGTRDIFYLFNQFSLQTNEPLINLANPGTCNATVVNPPFMTRKGAMGNGSSHYIRTNYNPYVNGVHYTLNSASIGAGSVLEKSVETGNIISAYDGSTYTQIGNRWSDGNSYWFINAVVAQIDSVSSTTAIGNWMANRTGANNCDLWRNKTKTTGTKTSSAITNKEIYIFCRNNNGSPSLYSKDMIDYAHAGGAVSDVQAQTFSDSIDAFRTAVQKIPNDILIEDNKHVDYINGVYQFGWNATNIFYSSNNGSTWTSRSFTGADIIESSVIFSNGNVWFSRLNKSYKSLDGLATAPVEVIALDKNGNPWTAQNNVGGTNASFFKKSASIDIVLKGGIETAIWGNYANVIVTEDNCPINIFAMKNDCIPKIQYTFGINPVYPNAGDISNAVICRHAHNVCYCADVDEWYLTTGDFSGAFPWLKGIYNFNDNTSTWSVITNSPAVSLNLVTAAIKYLNGYIYFGIDAASGIIYKVLLADLQNVQKYEYVCAIGNHIYNFKIQDDGVGIATGLGYILVTQDSFLNNKIITIGGYTGDFLNIVKISDNNYKVEKYTPPYYHHNSIYIEIDKT